MTTARTALTLAALLLLGALTSSPAAAHSTLISACPGPGDVFDDLTIEAIELDFSSALVDDGIAQIDLLGDNGQTEIAIGPTVFDEDMLQLSAALPSGLDLQPGRYIVRYRVTSLDGDENDGGFEFTIDPDATTDADACALPDGGSGAGGWVLLGVGVVAVGALVFLLRPRKSAGSSGP